MSVTTHGARGVARARKNLRKGFSPLRGLTAAEVAAAQDQFSTFVDTTDARGFIVSSSHRIHALETPRPWIHLMSSLHPRSRGVYGSFWDQTGRGFSCLDTVLAGPVTSHTDTSYVPTSPREPDCRLFYLREESPRGAFRPAGGRPADIWFLVPQPGREDEAYREYECRQGVGEVAIAAECRGIAGAVHAFVAHDDPVEVWTIRLRNRTRRARRLTLFTRVNWDLRSYPGYYFDMRCVCSGLFDPAVNGVAVFNNDQNNKVPRSGLLMSDTRVAGYDLSREAFDGAGVFRPFPEAVIAGRCRGSLGKAPYAGLAGVLQQSIRLRPGEEKTIHTLLGAASAEPAEAQTQHRAWFRLYLAGGAPERALGRVRAAWRRRCEANLLKTGDAEIDRFFNVWSKYQAANQSRFTRALDLVGYRDVIQDLMGVCDFDPAYVRHELLTALGFQLPDGRAIRQYSRFKGTRHDVRMYMDSPIWIPDTLVSYLKETGDFAILDEKAPFFDLASQKTSDAPPRSVYEHAVLAVRSCYTHRGLKGLCLAGHGDWNDALDGIGHGGKGVSVWLTTAVVYAAGLMRTLAGRLGRKADAAWLANVQRTLTGAVNRAAWDGRYYVYGFNDKGQPLGSRRNPEGYLHLNVNSWAILSGVAGAAGPGRVRAVLKALDELATPLGYRLLMPSYTHRSRHVGRIADVLPGLFENGSIYTHGQSFVAAALLSLGKAGEAWEAMKMTMPSRTLPALATTPPHQQSNFTVGADNTDYGMQYYSNFTGSLNWYRKNLDRMGGVLADFDGVRIDPCVPSWLKSYEVSKVVRGCRYDVRVDNRAGVCTGVKSIAVDGRRIEGAMIPASPAKRRKVEVVMGRR